MVFRPTLETGLLRALTRHAQRHSFPLVVAAMATAATLSMSVPFASILVAAVLLAPGRWFMLALGGSVGSALGAALLYLVFHHLGWARFFDSYPEVVRSAAWADATRWLGTYGTPALLLISALPLPLTPALMFAAISRLPVAEVIVALWAGKLLKYVVYAWLAAAFPSTRLRTRQRQLDALGAALTHATSERDARKAPYGNEQPASRR
ncbi:YqaA family protein [Azohydromonas lata]|uniref:VTT domain-containing protein n=1 Tax=Azohydromonas lata TaxID=45677 RepID=A0ABU5I968_9BURK|nr:VTT domain-containing protein [Azohydromonas lata]MDZ5455652.1 VTT domain-containing protein [Azohydromonas lata]